MRFFVKSKTEDFHKWLKASVILRIDGQDYDLGLKMCPGTYLTSVDESSAEFEFTDFVCYTSVTSED